MRPSARFVGLAIVCATAGCDGCSKRTASGVAAGGSDGGVTRAGGGAAAVAIVPSAWDGPFGAARFEGGRVFVAVAASREAALGVVELSVAGGALGAPTPVAGPQRPLPSAPSVLPLGTSAAAVVFTDRLGDPPSALLVSAQRAQLGEAAPIGPDYCPTEEDLFFIDKASRKLGRWNRAEPKPRSAEGPTFVEHSILLCGARRAFVIEPRGAGFDVVASSGGPKARLVDDIDPTAGGTYTFHVSGDSLGVVASRERGTVLWSRIRAFGEQPIVHNFSRRVDDTQSIVVADASDDVVDVVFQREGKLRCSDDEKPPVYEIVEAHWEGTGKAERAIERVVELPEVGCDAEISPPDVQRIKAGVVVRWFEWKGEGPEKGDGKEKTLRTWFQRANAGPTDAPKLDSRRVPGDTVLLDCDDAHCYAVGRSTKLELIATP